MDLKAVGELIRPELFILVVFLWCVGLFLKKAPRFSAEWVIPYLLLGISIISTVVYMATVIGDGFTKVVIVTGTIQGVLIASVTVFGNELLKQVTTKRVEDKEE